jgi:hypothetical protein
MAQWTRVDEDGGEWGKAGIYNNACHELDEREEEKPMCSVQWEAMNVTSWVESAWDAMVG